MFLPTNFANVQDPLRTEKNVTFTRMATGISFSRTSEEIQKSVFHFNHPVSVLVHFKHFDH